MHGFIEIQVLLYLILQRKHGHRILHFYMEAVLSGTAKFISKVHIKYYCCKQLTLVHNEGRD